nr:immunoglobulin heavy chain junction region [Macaca mulatta]MOW32256.1 immunoglobulin heavy chain junction region [Macaca mulatta]MOW32461.1 immunoglobulin heavy chain junction region [Macaca mulatta]MOW32531.1 immunoglobulin heavy chain junction region [Macaca mulatta]MOW32718.1 immunoglobulin heavy chain junction region [Macaca mulatta]
CWAAGATDDYW